MKILAAETSGKTFSVALNEDDKTIAQLYYDCGLLHSEMLIPLIEKILKDTNNSYQTIDRFAVSTGPGSFTGIRVAMTVIKTFAQALNKPIAAIDTLTVLESSFFCFGKVKKIAAIDALRNEVYVKDKDGIVIKPVETLCKELKKYKGEIIIVGDAAISYKEIFSKHLGAKSISLPQILHFPKASALALLAKTIKPKNYSQVSPVYIRQSWAEESLKNRK
jgi:tRNA threonylcarbamoyladenosine biosynthesis protein TsaB